MKRLFALGLSLGLVAALAVPAFAGGPAEKATGSFTYNVAGKYVAFNAHEATDKHPAKGYLFIIPDGVNHYTVAIDTVDVDGEAGTACFSGIISATGKYADRDGKAQAFFAKDGGEPSIDVDFFGASGVGSLSCPNLGRDVLTGNIQVH